MKPWIFKIGGLGLLLPLMVMSDAARGQSETNALPATTAAAPPANPGASLPPNIIPSPALADVIKLAQSGVSEEVLLAYVNNTDGPFNLSSDEIIYLNDLGVPDSVAKAMLQKNQAVTVSAPPAPSAPPVTQSAYAQPQPETNYDSTPPSALETPPPPMDLSAEGGAPPPPDAQPADLSDDDFYDALSPYGSWQQMDGYGWCWQPTVETFDTSWQPYCNNGCWVYTDCGWYWHSDYTWGSVAFHYGRWFHDPRRGWCWRPDRTWGPGWVSWRYNNSYCGWAALPPSAHFTTGYGLSIGMHATAGLNAGSFTFVPWGLLTDARPSRDRLPEVQAEAVFGNTTVVNDIASVNNTVLNRGITPEQVVRITHRQVPRFNIQDARGGLGEHFGYDGHTLVVNSPGIPETRVQPATAPAARQVVESTADNRTGDSYGSYAGRDNGWQDGQAGRLQGQPLIVRGNYTPEVAAHNGGVTVIGQSFAPPHGDNPYVTYATGQDQRGTRYAAPPSYASQYSQAWHYSAPVYTPSYSAPAPRYEPRVSSYSPPRQQPASAPRASYGGGSSRSGNSYNR